MMGWSKVTCLFALTIILSSCTNAGTVPPRNLASVLTPQSTDVESTASAGADLETTLSTGTVDQAEPDDTTAASPTNGDDADVQTAANTAETADATEVAEATTDEPADGKADGANAGETTTALAAEPAKAANPFSAFLKSQSAASRPRANVGDDRAQARNTRARSTFRKPAKTRQVARLTVTRSTSGSASRGSTGSLPGVSMKNVFAIDEEESGESDYLAGGDNEAARVASLTNMARRGDHGLLLQRPGVNVGCFPPGLLTILKRVERKFGRTPIVTSGYRSPSYNRKIRGAKKSLHVRCLAADIQVQGVSKWTLATYLRGLPGRGGVGTYCHTKSVHIDIGTKRDWNRRCRRKKRA